MPNLPWEGGRTNYTPSQSVTSSFSQSVRLFDSLSNTASVQTFTSTRPLSQLLAQITCPLSDSDQQIDVSQKQSPDIQHYQLLFKEHFPYLIL